MSVERDKRLDDEIRKQHEIIQAEEENRLREATAIQVFPMFLQMCTHVNKSPIDGQVKGINTDVIKAATLAWQSAEALAGGGKMSNRGRAFAPDETKQPEPKGIIQ